MNDEDKESTPEFVQEVTDKDFKVFYYTNTLDTSQSHTSVDMGFEEKTPYLFALLTTHVGGFALVVAMVPRPPTSATTHMSSANIGDKKRKRAQRGKSTEGTREGEITQSSHQPPAKEARIGKGSQRSPHPLDLPTRSRQGTCLPSFDYLTKLYMHCITFMCFSFVQSVQAVFMAK